MVCFGKPDPRQVPEHFFTDALEIDVDSAIRGNPEKQNDSVCPRHWHLDATFACNACGRTFTWTVAEQQSWFEEWFFWVDVSPRQCRDCRKARRGLVVAKKEYDRIVGEARSGGSIEQKRRVLQILDELEAGLRPLAASMVETRRVFTIQVEREGS